MANETAVTNQAINEASAHVLPGVVAWLIDNGLLPLLLVAEGYLMGSLFARGWVRNIETPSQWGVYHAIGVMVFYAAGAATAGLGLRASVTFAASLRLKRWGFAFLNLLTVMACRQRNSGRPFPSVVSTWLPLRRMRRCCGGCISPIQIGRASCRERV